MKTYTTIRRIYLRRTDSYFAPQTAIELQDDEAVTLLQRGCIQEGSGDTQEPPAERPEVSNINIHQDEEDTPEVIEVLVEGAPKTRNTTRKTKGDSDG